MLRTVPASEWIVQVLRQPLRFPGLGDPQVHSRLAFPAPFSRLCRILRQAGHPEPAKFRHLFRGGDVVRPETEQVKGGEVRQFPEPSHGGEVPQVSRRAPEPQLLQVGMNSSQSGQIKVLQLDAMQPSWVRQFRVRAVFPDKLEGQTAAIFGGMDGTGYA